jgi:hypothetical protein
MKIFGFDNFWGLDWLKTKNCSYYCKMRDFVYTADTTVSSKPVFAIYRKEVTPSECLIDRLDTDSFIMQLKSIGEHGKIVKK